MYDYTSDARGNCERIDIITKITYDRRTKSKVSKVVYERDMSNSTGVCAGSLTRGYGHEIKNIIYRKTKDRKNIHMLSAFL